VDQSKDSNVESGKHEEAIVDQSKDSVRASSLLTMKLDEDNILEHL